MSLELPGALPGAGEVTPMVGVACSEVGVAFEAVGVVEDAPAVAALSSEGSACAASSCTADTER